MNKIYLKLNKKPETLKELITELFSIPSWSMVYAVKTYSDEQCTVEQCPEKKRRTITDLRIIANTYFEGTTDKELITELLLLRPNALHINKCYFCGLICTKTKDITLCYDHVPYIGDKNEWSVPYENNYFKVEYSWFELIRNNLELNSEVKIIEFINKNS
jgi:hypothetical protein